MNGGKQFHWCIAVLLVSMLVASCGFKQTASDSRLNPPATDDSDQCLKSEIFVNICRVHRGTIGYDRLYNYVKNSSAIVNIPDGKPINFVTKRETQLCGPDEKSITTAYFVCGCRIVFNKDKALTFEKAAVKWAELQRLGQEK